MSIGFSYIYRLSFAYQQRNSYVEWENDPERKRIATELLKTKKFTSIPGKFVLYSLYLEVDAIVHPDLPRVPVRASTRHEPNPYWTSMEGIS